MGMLEFIKSNLGHVLPILLAAGFAVAIVLERARSLFVTYPIQNDEKFFDGVQDSVLKGKIAEAVAICDRYHDKPVAQVVKAGLLRAHQPKEMIEDGLAIVVEQCSQKLYKRTHFLAMVGNVATLLGLLGTIAGLVTSFEAMGSDKAALTAQGLTQAQLLAQGISQAMNATMLGLGVAIPCIIAFSFLMNRTNQLVSGCETAAVRTMDMLKQRYFESESKVVTQRPGVGVA
jgi:biopolymer transport protein ExbB